MHILLDSSTVGQCTSLSYESEGDKYSVVNVVVAFCLGTQHRLVWHWNSPGDMSEAAGSRVCLQGAVDFFIEDFFMSHASNLHTPAVPMLFSITVSLATTAVWTLYLETYT